jgi:colanic acid biosynthesis glycosyl transferase WcaI
MAASDLFVGGARRAGISNNHFFIGSERRMVRAKRILVHDYSGHPFQAQLSRVLARRGYDVLHVHFAGFQTPKGDLGARPDDPAGLRIVGLSLDEPFHKDGFVKRRLQEIAVGRLVADEIRRFRPDVVLSSNAPLDTQAVIHKAARGSGARFVFWLQDIYSEAIGRILSRTFPVIGSAIARRYHALEYQLLRASDHVVAITDDFVAVLARNGVPGDRVSVIENWAPIEDMGSVVQGARAEGGSVRAVYAGTLGYKHNPEMLLAAASAVPVTIDVYSEGSMADRLASQAASQGLANLRVRPWVPFANHPSVLGGADILIAMIERDAGIFSVPSKVLTYFCCGRSVLASVPGGNLARRIIEREEAGLVSEPERTEDFVGNLRRLAEDRLLRDRLGDNGRSYAERNFAIDAIADRFETIFDAVYHQGKQAI